ncbi:MAG: zinc-dependent peptidase [Chitinophagaceae bacterium]|nr:zinc-dependent peptidase [Chitinophagaceae bacterium]MCW5927722.1 zinc-dependent peptidase [Chitinophagaceae bacterium]
MPPDTIPKIQFDSLRGVSAVDTMDIATIIERVQADSYNDSPDFFYGVAIILLVVLAILMIGKWLKAQTSPMLQATETGTPETAGPSTLIYHGKDLAFSNNEINAVLTKHFPYYNKLSEAERERFILRLKQFMISKIFVIYDKRGFREMPILLSATAVKLSFGLKNYLLPFYKSIHIFPEEFIGTNPTIRVLAGNVSGNRIHVSWKHFLEGIRDPEDGSNLGLHEMAHAYYFQNFETGRAEDEGFVYNFEDFNQVGNKIFEAKRTGGHSFYSGYAMTNFQEFWAESVELFFEKPVVFRQHYPELYNIMAKLLNQDTAGFA